MTVSNNYSKTKIACYLGFITQAIVANFTPLLFMAFHREYRIPIATLALIPAVFYIVQLVTDLLCAKFKNLDYRRSIILSEITSALGLVGLAFLPQLFPTPLVGILLCVAIYAVGSGLIEVLCSPIIEACPFPNKEGMMSLLHSFYCVLLLGCRRRHPGFYSVLLLLRTHQLAYSGLPVGTHPAI